jgi:hypothetical protein
MIKYPAFQEDLPLWVGTVCFMTCYLHKVPVNFHLKIWLFVTVKFDQDPDPVCMDPLWFGCLDPDPHD